MPTDQRLYKVSFINQGKLYELFARNVYQGDMFGFVVIEELVFGERSQVVVDPSEEKLRGEFENVRRLFIPMHAIVRIDEVEKQGIAKIKDVGENVTAFPGSVYQPSKPSGKS